MYYEETIIDGILNFRTSPIGEFNPYNLQQLTILHQKEKSKNKKLLAIVENISQLIEKNNDEL